MRIPDFTFVTGNRGKLSEVERILGRRPPSVDLDMPEIQSLDLVTVLGAKGEEAWRQLARPLVVDETGLSLTALNGFPGPLIKWLLEAVGAAGITRLAAQTGEMRATAQCALLFRDGERSLVATGETQGRLVPPRGTAGFGWDAAFLPEGQDQTYAELPPEVKDTIGHRGRAWRALIRLFAELEERP